MSDSKTDAFARALQTFHVEAQDMIEQMEQCLLAIEETPDDRELLNALFRSVHTIKGSGGLFGLEDLVGFTHEVETALDRLRAGQIRHSAELGSLLLQCADHIGNLLGHARKHPDQALAQDLIDDSRVLLKRLAPFAGTTAKPAIAAAPSTPAEADGCWHISLRFAADSFLHGIDPLATVRYLSTLGRLTLVEVIDQRVPPLSELQAEQCQLGFELRLLTQAPAWQLEDAFEFIRDECIVNLIEPQPAPDRFLKLIADLPDDAERLGEILLNCGAIDKAQLHRALARQHQEAAESDAPRPLGNILINDAGVDPTVVDAALQKQAKLRDTSDQQRFFRVPADKLDALINVVGELVIMSAAAKTQAQQAGHAQLIESSVQMGWLIEEIRNGALALRMVSIGESFSKFKRVVRDVAASLGKEVHLELEGADTELDKSVVEKIGDPLMHLVRNALDHGIETPEQRIAAGKDPVAQLKLSAWHDSGSIVIQVRDDGRGIDPQRIIAKARERGLLSAQAQPAQDEALALIFEPGFSTADKVSDLSGRGVGMDVVRRNIEALRGAIQISSEVGRGTAMTIRLPLTLAIIDGFLVRCGGSVFVIPLEHIEECIAGSDALAAQSAVGVINQRNVPLPVLSISRLLQIEAMPVARQSIVVVRCGERRAGLLVDQLLGEHQTVIKPLGQLFSQMRCVAGSTILGSGQVALILDTQALVEQAIRFTQRHCSAAPVVRPSLVANPRSSAA